MANAASLQIYSELRMRQATESLDRLQYVAVKRKNDSYIASSQIKYNRIALLLAQLDVLKSQYACFPPDRKYCFLFGSKLVRNQILKYIFVKHY